jgi:DNA replication initiation complex subunit (GINS family)
MYDELYAAWQWETDNTELGRLQSDFYSRVADYVKRIKEENRMLDKKNVKVVLLEHELQNVKRMLNELVRMRYRKLIRMATDGTKPQADTLTAEEKQVADGVLPIADTYQRFVTNILQGNFSQVNVEKTHERIPLRFIKNIPAIIGADMQTYGPFMAEDIGSVPVENAKILVKQGLAEIIQTAH